MSTFTNKTGLLILDLIASRKISYGKSTVAKMILGQMEGISLDQAKDLLQQLIESEYLKEINVGTSFAMIVLVLTDKGKAAILDRADISLDFQKFYDNSFKPATDVEVIDKDVLEEYYQLKRKLGELQQREEELKETIKKAMSEKNVSEIHSELIDLFCKNVQRVTYPKEKIERYVPGSILEKIRTVSEVTVLTTKLKGVKNDKAISG